MLVEPDDVNAMAECVCKLVDDSTLLRSITEKSLKKSESFYSNNVKMEWENLLGKIANR
jgi:glycosyltransferase involved in cell wall biosynthesis